MRPLGMTSSWARSGTVTVVHWPGVSGWVGFESELLCAASIQPRLTMPWSLSLGQLLDRVVAGVVVVESLSLHRCGSSVRADAGVPLGFAVLDSRAVIGVVAESDLIRSVTVGVPLIRSEAVQRCGQEHLPARDHLRRRRATMVVLGQVGIVGDRHRTLAGGP